MKIARIKMRDFCQIFVSVAIFIIFRYLFGVYRIFVYFCKK